MKQNNISLDAFLHRSRSVFEQYHEKTKIKKLERKVLDREDWPKEWKEVYYKAYGRLEEKILPVPNNLPGFSLQKILELRTSERRFSQKPISNKTLSSFLYFSAGLKKENRASKIVRFYPSAGARYPLEVYLITLNCQTEKGLYHYYIKNNSLEKLLPLKRFDFKKYFNQDWISKAGALIIITAVFKRNTIKYGDRGYRHILIEAGHLAQNLYLVATAQNLNICAIGGYNDLKIEKLLDIDGLSESIIYVLAVGRH